MHAELNYKKLMTWKIMIAIFNCSEHTYMEIYSFINNEDVLDLSKHGVLKISLSLDDDYQIQFVVCATNFYR